MPIVPEKYESAEVFCRWWKDVAEYCERHPMFVRFKKIPGHPNVIENILEIMALFENVDEELPTSRSKLSNSWEMAIAEKELYGAAKHVLQGKCAEIVSQVANGRGFELLRILALKFDLVMPHLRQMIMASIYGLANDKCKDFWAMVARIAYIGYPTTWPTSAESDRQRKPLEISATRVWIIRRLTKSFTTALVRGGCDVRQCQHWEAWARAEL